ncbi:MAG: type II toxin-antitoxin system VapC family toxin [Alphaproteobacteria bacterium]|nr:type II toxin-antitoxin system VapC family toxin [Alphaproteobacteria bacterium]
MMLYMLDTNIVSDALRNPRGSVAKRISQTNDEDICLSIVVAAELRFGAAKRGSKTLTMLIEGFIERTQVMPLGPSADQFYAELRLSLEKAGTPMGGNDMLIAAHALALGATLVTDNEREFARIKSLNVENWLQ